MLEFVAFALSAISSKLFFFVLVLYRKWKGHEGYKVMGLGTVSGVFAVRFRACGKVVLDSPCSVMTTFSKTYEAMKYLKPKPIIERVCKWLENTIFTNPICETMFYQP